MLPRMVTIPPRRPLKRRSRRPVVQADSRFPADAVRFCGQRVSGQLLGGGECQQEILSICWTGGAVWHVSTAEQSMTASGNGFRLAPHGFDSISTRTARCLGGSYPAARCLSIAAILHGLDADGILAVANRNLPGVTNVFFFVKARTVCRSVARKKHRIARIADRGDWPSPALIESQALATEFQA